MRNWLVKWLICAPEGAGLWFQYLPPPLESQCRCEAANRCATVRGTIPPQPLPCISKGPALIRAPALVGKPPRPSGFPMGQALARGARSQTARRRFGEPLSVFSPGRGVTTPAASPCGGAALPLGIRHRLREKRLPEICLALP
jgi:hypothetical protein